MAINGPETKLPHAPRLVAEGLADLGARRAASPTAASGGGNEQDRANGQGDPQSQQQASRRPPAAGRPASIVLRTPCAANSYHLTAAWDELGIEPVFAPVPDEPPATLPFVQRG